MPDTPNTPEVEDLIRYDVLAQEALRGVVKKVLHEVARTGLPGDHHFYITFDTQYAGVRMSSRMRDKYPEEMTIVIQHQFWDLESTDHGFSIGLSFDNIPEALSIPFAAIRGFFDPSVQFGLQFEAVEEEDGAESREEAAETSALPSPPDLEKLTDESGQASDEDSDSEGSAEVVSLDAFRKK
ncbi:MAG: SspB family protein [Rhizobiaceae bacterium]